MTCSSTGSPFRYELIAAGFPDSPRLETFAEMPDTIVRTTSYPSYAQAPELIADVKRYKGLLREVSSNDYGITAVKHSFVIGKNPRGTPLFPTVYTVNEHSARRFNVRVRAGAIRGVQYYARGSIEILRESYQKWG